MSEAATKLALATLAVILVFYVLRRAILHRERPYKGRRYGNTGAAGGDAGSSSGDRHVDCGSESGSAGSGGGGDGGGAGD